MITKSIILVPFWVETSLLRNSLKLADVVNFEKLRPILSLDDLVGLLTLQTIPVLKSLLLSDGMLFNYMTLFNSWLNSAGVNGKDVELSLNIHESELGNEIRTEVNTRLSIEPPENTPVYKITDVSPEHTIIVLNEGFSLFISNPDNILIFIRDILKVFYVYNTVEEVSLLPIFGTYVKVLGKSLLTRK